MAFKNILISLVIVILLSLFLFIADYRDKISNAEITRQQLSLLEILDPLTDTDERLAQLLKNGNEQAWIHLAKHHANESASTAFQLGEYYLKQKQVSAAQLWYQLAIRQHHVTARLALANSYFDQHQYADIKSLLLPILNNEKALALLYKLALQQGDLSFIQAYKSKLAHGDNAGLFNELEQFSVFSQNVRHKSEHNTACSIDVQLFATNLAGLRHGKQLTLAFEGHKLAKYICVLTPKYIPAEVVNCQHQPTDKIRCNASKWLQRSDINSRYLGVIVEQGSANVDNGIMYIDQQDNLDVLVHELSHFIGFVDEYPLPKQHQKCQQFQQTPFAHNLVVLDKYYQGERGNLRESILLQLPWRSLVKDSTPILSNHPQGWQLGTPVEHNNEIGLFTTNSCNSKRDTQAFKPLAHRTKLEYFELDFPDIYLNIMKLDPKRYLMPSYHFNISRDLVGQGKYIKASEVLQVTLFK
ncbi:hypothetical protein [Cognaticolwellia beringensis]|uniref:Uncharacterized protein n=1 Tax=Cognaticolwellia beringensis TaxID=1967665 RepID=A0A222GC46_9GAMM|nr:hypothetical protein [Cognaticolwellia beringensis]ASP49243.1 hypothetical protein B5D82_16580 [Cognaticolwellia beringensis]